MQEDNQLTDEYDREFINLIYGKLLYNINYIKRY